METDGRDFGSVIGPARMCMYYSDMETDAVPVDSEEVCINNPTPKKTCPLFFVGPGMCRYQPEKWGG